MVTNEIAILHTLGRVDKVWEAMGFWATATGS
jgi:hypothetical protein